MNLKKSHKLKELKTLLTKTKLEYDSVLNEVKNKQKLEASLKTKLVSLQNQISEFENESKESIISEHTLLRYFERVLEYDLTAIATQLVPDSSKPLIKTMGSGKVPGIGCTLVFKDGVVVTVEKAA